MEILTIHHHLVIRTRRLLSKAFLIKAPRDKLVSNQHSIQSHEGVLPQDNHSLIDSIKSSSSDLILIHYSDFDLNLGNNSPSHNKDYSQIILNNSSNCEKLPTHLKPIPSTLAIPKRYNWIFIHDG